MNTPNGRHAWTVTVGTKGQIVIPKEARDLRSEEHTSELQSR